MQETNNKLIQEEIEAKVNTQLEQKLEEYEQLRAQNAELLSKLQQITNEFAVMKSDAEIVKQKARQMLIDKDEELERMRLSKNASNSQSTSATGGKTMISPGKDANTSNSRVDSQPDSGASTFSEGIVSAVIEADNTSMGGSQLITESR